MTQPDDRTEQGRDRGEDARRDDRAAAAERPDQRGPRGNQDVETIDVERGEGKLERVLGW
jgi:hypothetical protein